MYCSRKVWELITCANVTVCDLWTGEVCIFYVCFQKKKTLVQVVVVPVLKHFKYLLYLSYADCNMVMAIIYSVHFCHAYLGIKANHRNRENVTI